MPPGATSNGWVPGNVGGRRPICCGRSTSTVYGPMSLMNSFMCADYNVLSVDLDSRFRLDSIDLEVLLRPSDCLVTTFTIPQSVNPFCRGGASCHGEVKDGAGAPPSSAEILSIAQGRHRCRPYKLCPLLQAV